MYQERPFVEERLRKKVQFEDVCAHVCAMKATNISSSNSRSCGPSRVRARLTRKARRIRRTIL